MIGIFHWTNYWDFVIYYTVVLICIVFAAMYRYAGGQKKAVLGTAVLQAAEVFALGTAGGAGRLPPASRPWYPASPWRRIIRRRISF